MIHYIHSLKCNKDVFITASVTFLTHF